MDKIEAKYVIGLQYTKILEGNISFISNEVEYTFSDTISKLSGLEIAKQIARINGVDIVTFKDNNETYSLSVGHFDALIAIMMLTGNGYWEQKVARQSEIKVDGVDIDEIVSREWIKYAIV